jgi:hypothetical protein
VNVQANLIAHAVVGAVTSYASGNPALAGASGAVAGAQADKNVAEDERRHAIENRDFSSLD